jgi:hypothetical protein
MPVLLAVAFLPDLGEHTWNPIVCHQVHHTVHFLIFDCFWVHSYKLMLQPQIGQSFCQACHNGRFTTSSGSYNHEAVTHQRRFVKLDDLIGPFRFVNEILFSHLFLNSSLLFLVDLLWNVTLLCWEQKWESISQQGKEELNVIEDELRQVHVSQGSG